MLSLDTLNAFFGWLLTKRQHLGEQKKSMTRSSIRIHISPSTMEYRCSQRFKSVIVPLSISVGWYMMVADAGLTKLLRKLLSFGYECWDVGPTTRAPSWGWEKYVTNNKGLESSVDLLDWGYLSTFSMRSHHPAPFPRCSFSHEPRRELHQPQDWKACCLMWKRVLGRRKRAEDHWRNGGSLLRCGDTTRQSKCTLVLDQFIPRGVLQGTHHLGYHNNESH